MINKKLFVSSIIIFVILININIVYAKNFVFDNADVINNSEKLNIELDYLANVYNIVILIETTHEQVTDIDYDAKFHAYRLDDIGNPEFNLLIYYNVETGEGKIIHHTRAKLTDDIIEQTFFTDKTEKYFGEKDYENVFMEMVTSLKKIIPFLLQGCDKNKAKDLVFEIGDIHEDGLYEEAIRLAEVFVLYCKNNTPSYRFLINDLIFYSEIAYRDSDFDSSFNLAFTAYRLSDDDIKLEERVITLFRSIKAKRAFGDCNKVIELGNRFKEEFTFSKLISEVNTFMNRCTNTAENRESCELVSGGGDSSKLDVVFVADDYLSITNFEDDVDIAINGLLSSSEIIAENFNKFNIYRINKLEYPFDICHPIDPGNLAVCSTRLLAAVSRFYCPTDSIVVLSKHTFRSFALQEEKVPLFANFLGIDGFAFISRPLDDEAFRQVVVHEIGHSIFQLADEYVGPTKGRFPKYPNCAPNRQVAEQWWGDLIEFYDEVGFYPGCSYVESNLRPTENSVMRQKPERREFYIIDFGPVSDRHIQNMLDKYG